MSMEAASIAQHCQTLRLAAIGAQFASLAEEARQQNHSHLHYLEALLQAEVEERERRSIELRLKDAHLPRMKTLEEFDFAQSPHIPASRVRALAEGGYLERSEPVLLVGEPGTGKTHLATGLLSPPADSGGAYASPPLPRWSTNWSRHNANRASAACWHAGRAWN
jgi:DNA replication protein DnaC